MKNMINISYIYKKIDFMKTILLLLTIVSVQISFAQVSYEWTDNDSIVQDVDANASTQLKIEQTNISNSGLLLGVEIVYNDIPSTWDGMVCVFGTCFGTIPPVGFTGEMSEIIDPEKGYVRLTVNPLGSSDQVKLRVRVYDMANPTDSDTCTWILNSTPLSVFENNSNVEFSIFPVPANDKLTINTTEMIDAYEVYDITGKTILSSTLNQSISTIDVSALKNGVYFISIFNDEKLLGNKKFIVNE